MGDGCPKKKEEEESAADQAGGGWWFWFCFCNKREMIMMVFPVVGAFVGEATYDNGQHGRGFVLLGGGGGKEGGDGGRELAGSGMRRPRVW